MESEPSDRNETPRHPDMQQLAERYAHRDAGTASAVYSFLNPAVYMGEQEKERHLIRWIRNAGLPPLADTTLLEIGCGSGGNLLELIRLGFRPENLVGNELLQDRYTSARHRLPEATRLLMGDAAELDLPDESFDVVFQSTVFTSILSDEFQNRLAARMWALARPGGGVLWYDFIYDNPRNPDVRGVPVKRVAALFPEAEMTVWRLTLAPPVSRRVSRFHESLYTVCNAFPFLRTHILCWLKKPE